MRQILRLTISDIRAHLNILQQDIVFIVQIETAQVKVGGTDQRYIVINGERLGYSVAKQRHDVCSTYLPSILNPIVVPYMKATDTGMQLSVWLRKESNG